MEFDHSYRVGNFSSILDLQRVIPCVQGGRVISLESPDKAKAEIKVDMGSMNMTFTGTVEITEKDAGGQRATMKVRAREAGGQGHANAVCTFSGGTLHTSAQVTGKAAQMGEGTIRGVLDGLISDFVGKLPSL
jgi:carbon monoxide dehydrogenase subunit G